MKTQNLLKQAKPSEEQKLKVASIYSSRIEDGFFLFCHAYMTNLEKLVDQLNLDILAKDQGYKNHKAKVSFLKRQEIKAKKELLAITTKNVKENKGRYLVIQRNWSKGGKGHFNKKKDTYFFSEYKTNHKTCILITKENYEYCVKTILTP